MKRVTYLSIGFLVTSLLLVSVVSAHGPGDSPMGDHPGGYTPPMTNMNGFNGEFDHMDISGTVDVSDAIVISFTVSPSEEMQSHMEDRQGNMNDHMMSSDFVNTITVTIPNMVEYLDMDANGYTSNDTILSVYGLNTSTLNEPAVTTDESGTIYTISSTDGIFTMYLYLNENDGVPHSWKWSVEIFDYPFMSEESEIAIVHQIDSNGGQTMMPHREQMMHHEQMMGDVPKEGQIHSSQLMDEHAQVPMYFKWDSYATVDDVELNITASLVDEAVAISIPQGASIFYDPEVGLESESISQANDILGDTFDTFSTMINSPTVIGLLLGAFLIITVVGITKYRQ